MTSTIPLRLNDQQPTLHHVRISDVRQYVYCPRVIWWTFVCPVRKRETFKMQLGQRKEQRLQKLQQRRTLRAFGLAQGDVECNVDLHSSDLALSGRLDMLLNTGTTRYPVEIKYTHGSSQQNHRMQLAGYAIIVEAIYGTPVPCGFLVRLPDDTAEAVPITDELRQAFYHEVASLRRILDSQLIPPPNIHPRKCTDCEYRNHCGDVHHPY